MRAAALTLALLTGIHWSSLGFAAGPEIEITTCGQAVPRHAVGFLSGDLDCTGTSQTAVGSVLLNRAATLELRGHTITGGRFGVICGELHPDKFGNIGLYSSGKCKVLGGNGLITGAEAHGIAGDNVEVRDLTIEHSGQEGVYSRLKGRLENVTVNDSGGIGARLDTSAKLINCTISGSGELGVASGGRIVLFGSRVVGNGVGPDCFTSVSNPCGDLYSGRQPRVERGSHCGTSLVAGGGLNRSWHVCTFD